MHLAVANKHFPFYTVCSTAFPARIAPLSWVAGFAGRYKPTVFQWPISHQLVLDELPTTWSTGVLSPFGGWGSPSTDLGPSCAHSRTSATPHKGAQECFRFSGLQNFGSCSCRAQGSPAAGSAPEELPAERSIPCSSRSSTVLANSLSSSWFWRSQLQLWEVLQNELLRGASLDQRVLTLLLMPDFQAKMKPSPRLLLLFFFFFSCNQIQCTSKMFLSTRHRQGFEPVCIKPYGW